MCFKHVCCKILIMLKLNANCTYGKHVKTNVLTIHIYGAVVSRYVSKGLLVFPSPVVVLIAVMITFTLCLMNHIKQSVHHEIPSIHYLNISSSDENIPVLKVYPIL